MTERKDIGLRLENWARWATAKSSGGPDCMTGAICEGLRKAALGNVWSGHALRVPIDDSDAVKIELGMRQVPLAPRMLLHWCYIEQAQPEVVCRKMSIPKPEFVERFRAAQALVEEASHSEGER